MGEHLSKSEMRRKKEKAKLEAKKEEEERHIVILPPTPKQVAMEKSSKKGFSCYESQGVLMFEPDKKDEITQWLLNEFGQEEADKVKRVPFSFGFGVKRNE